MLAKIKYFFTWTLPKIWEDIKYHNATSIWCGWCGETHLIGAMDDIVCAKTGQSLQGLKAWRVNGWTVGTNNEKQDIFIAWDNYAKWQGRWKEKLVTEHKVWTMMFNNAYDKHKNGQEKVKGCKDCQKSDLHKPDFERTYLKASWREEDTSGYEIDTLNELKRFRELEDLNEKLATLLRCGPSEIGVKINKLLKDIAELEAQITTYNKPKPDEPLQK